MTLEAIIFGGLGTLAECAEQDRQAWNAAFRIQSIGWNWSWDTYAELMRPGGDRQLAARYAAHKGEIVEAAHLDEVHQRLFAAKLSQGIALRPGVARVLSWAARAGLKLGLVTRAEAPVVRALLSATARDRGGLDFDVAVLRTDVDRMAPDPQAMQRAVDQLGVGTARVVAVCDTPATARGARAADVPVLAFPGRLSEAEPEGFGPSPLTYALSPETLTMAWRQNAPTAAE